jgi:hypothetical protein
MYKPNFCAECGERVARKRWRAWTSRRFCPACDAGGRTRRITAPLALGVCLVFFGFVLGRAGRPAPPPLVVIRGGAATGEVEPRAAGEAGAKAEGGAGRPGPAYGADGTASERPTDPLEVVSICGARTKKGTPCSRRVRGSGRCWQHRGKPAVLPPQKLIVPS